MDIEQLKLILNTVSAVSGDALSVAASYILVANILPFIGWMVAGFGAYKLAKELISKLSAHTDEAFFIEMRDFLRVGCSGHLSDDEKAAVKIRVKNIVYSSVDKK